MSSLGNDNQRQSHILVDVTNSYGNDNQSPLPPTTWKRVKCSIATWDSHAHAEFPNKKLQVSPDVSSSATISAEAVFQPRQEQWVLYVGIVVGLGTHRQFKSSGTLSGHKILQLCLGVSKLIPEQTQSYCLQHRPTEPRLVIGWRIPLRHWCRAAIRTAAPNQDCGRIKPI